MSGMCARWVRNAYEMHIKRARDASVQVQNLAIKLQKDLINCHALFAKRGMSLKRVQDASGTCPRCVLDVCKRYLGAELYSTYTTKAKIIKVAISNPYFCAISK